MASGVFVNELDTQYTRPTTSDTIQVVIGTAPVNMIPYNTLAKSVNAPLYATELSEATQQLGFSYDFESYTLCQAMYANFQMIGVSPLILINVLDPTKHKKAIETTTVSVADGEATINEKGILLSSLVLKSGDTTLAEGTEYAAEFDDDGNVAIAVSKEGVTSLTITGDKIDPSAVTAKDVAGGVDKSGNETGIEILRQVYPKYNKVPTLILAPGYSRDATVCSALQAKTTKLNSCFRTFFVADIDSSATGARSYTEVSAQKVKQALTSAYGCAIWCYGAVGEYRIAGSVLVAATLAYWDAQKNGIPSEGPHNRTIAISAAVLEDGTEVLLDLDQANTVNDCGCMTLLNMNGWRLWGSETCAYPNSGDMKDEFINVRRLLNWDDNTFILTYFSKVGRTMNPYFIQNILQSEKVRGASLVSNNIFARHETVYLSSDNPNSDIVSGTVTFRTYSSPYPPTKLINETIEIDVDSIASALAAVTV